MQTSNTVFKPYVLLFLLLFLSGCATPSFEDNFEKSFVDTGRFIITSYDHIKNPDLPVNVYIEGDGNAWVSRDLLSDDPTPKEPLVLRLAALDPAENVAYLARPGQYSRPGTPGCDASYWSDKRFSDEVINAMDRTIDKILSGSGAKGIHLIGYSGGGAIAVLIAARRKDVLSIRTIAGNLDPGAVNRYHKVSPLKGSLDPMDAAKDVSGIPQRHFTGSKDKVVPGFIAKNFAVRSGDARGISITEVEGAAHGSGWVGRWKKLLVIAPVRPKENN